MPWSSVVDGDETLVETYKVSGYPSFYLVDREGVLRVAKAHDYGLEAGIKALLAEEL